MTRLTRAEVAGQKFDFGAELKAAETSAEAAIDATADHAKPPGKPGSSSVEDEADEDLPEEQPSAGNRPEPESSAIKAMLVSSQPTGLVMRSWLSIESAVDRLHRAVFGAPRDGKPTTTQRQVTELLDYVPDTAAESIQRMRKIRNEVAHGSAQVDLGEAIAYAENAAKVVDLLGYLERTKA